MQQIQNRRVREFRAASSHMKNEKKKPVHSIEEAPQLELKPLPGGFKYEYLGPGKLKPRWDGLVVVKDPRDGRILKVNGQRRSEERRVGKEC